MAVVSWIGVRSVSHIFLLHRLLNLLTRSICLFSDLSGDFKNAPCKRRYAETQEVFYTGWTHIHRLKVEEEYFSNGISTVYGRMSYQHPDIGRDCNLQDTSGLNAFL